ncbi:hypothetical protein YB2330_005579 [Saitoella coloradoensis]
MGAISEGDSQSNKTYPASDLISESFLNERDIEAFGRALQINEHEETPANEFITALHDWAPVRQQVPKSKEKESSSTKKKAKGRKRSSSIKDETREGVVYPIMRWPLLIGISLYVQFLACLYLLIRLYINIYEHIIIWRGTPLRLRNALRNSTSYTEWLKNAINLDKYMGHEEWKKENEYAYYDHVLIRKSFKRLRSLREKGDVRGLRSVLEECVKGNFGGIENPRLYSQTYYGTKRLIDQYLDEVDKSLNIVINSSEISQEDKRVMLRYLAKNYGRTALCLSGGASFAYYHFGVVKALLEADLLPNVITGTSGGGVIAALACTRTKNELKELLTPDLHAKITACKDPPSVWLPRFWKTGARFDALDWARAAMWFCRGSMTFREAYERTGRILNISVIPSDVHSPPKLINYLTAPDTVIWSTLLASSAVPGILNPVVLMMKVKDENEKDGYRLVPYNFGHRWKDGSLRTDIPLQSLNTHFNVTYSIVSQTNPHISLFFFSARGNVGRPVAHRKGKGWRGGFLGSLAEQYLKLDLGMWMRVLRDLELLPRPASQDWSNVFLQRFDGTVTITPKTVPSDFWYILNDPNRERLERMILSGQRKTWPKLLFIKHRLSVERIIERGRALTRKKVNGNGSGSGRGSGVSTPVEGGSGQLGVPVGEGTILSDAEIEASSESYAHQAARTTTNGKNPAKKQRERDTEDLRRRSLSPRVRGHEPSRAAYDSPDFNDHAGMIEDEMEANGTGSGYGLDSSSSDEEDGEGDTGEGEYEGEGDVGDAFISSRGMTGAH